MNLKRDNFKNLTEEEFLQLEILYSQEEKLNSEQSRQIKKLLKKIPKLTEEEKMNRAISDWNAIVNK